MSTIRATARLSQIERSIINKECHRATCSLMDFVRDYTVVSVDLQGAVELRKKYNSLRELGASDITEQDAIGILQEASTIFNRIKEYSYDTIEASLLQAYPQFPVLRAADVIKKYSQKGNFTLGPVSTVLKALAK